MTPLHIVSLILGGVGALASYLVTADPTRAGLWQTIGVIVSALLPVFAMGVGKLGAKS